MAALDRRRVHDAQSHAGGNHGHGAPHESPWVMVVPLLILALLSFVGGWIGVPHSLNGSDHFDAFLSPVFQRRLRRQWREAAAAESKPESEDSSTELAFTCDLGRDCRAWLCARLVALLQAAGIAGNEWPRLPAVSTRLVLDKYKIDELYGAVIIQPLIALSTNVFWKGIDRGLIDRRGGRRRRGCAEVSDEMRQMQSGNIRSYAGWVAVGAAAVIAFMVWRGVR